MLKIKNSLSIGPAAMVAAAFIGPGTVITASLAGANYGYALLWALLFAMLASIILQEMAARLGLVTGRGLGENIRDALQRPLWRWPAMALVVSAIVIGNAAYESGNLAGASAGLKLLTEAGAEPADTGTLWPIAVAAIAAALLWSGSYRTIERALIALVALMSLAFLLTFALSRPDMGALLSGLLVPSLPAGATLTAIALIGTTVVPYNLFLHSSSVSQKWQSAEQLPLARRDIFFSIPLGGLISIAIASTAASAFFAQQLSISSASEMARSLEPLFGTSARYCMGVGLFAAGISSALTAPLASAYALCGILGKSPDLKAIHFRAIWLAIIVIGALVAIQGIRPLRLIWFAQIANGLLLPIVTAFLLWTMNSSRLGLYRNAWWQNALGLLVLVISVVLGGRSLLAAFGWL
ncbi:Nramp family divalent metal transporter [Microbulbifer hydrolyticus]|uniref:Divalent metal cation transporter n=1 Tax=Microbulbifer hydrolyticus TaxID=48074 RepID=A0A6P1TBE9_9GAMM|nr:Nramp family divalent metal transporter [Microbulbifer hydrolyticus]MBB5212460.1 Mn2+/Fe2+ NRAMP family transporter [Microbulbifer hydrolyticus]QHQ40088.1 divalent metal cation transporter [Microbulbifer hydrolyticus]